MLPEDYQAPTLFLESVLFQVVDGQLTVLIGKTAAESYEGQWVLPGGYCTKGETTRQALDRIMIAKVGIDLRRLGLTEQLHTFDMIAGDGRGQAVDVVYLSLGYNSVVGIDNPAAALTFTPLPELPSLAYDHRTFIDYGVTRLRLLLNTTNVAASLMPDIFLLSSLQKIYEAVLGRPLDKRNFRKKILSYDILEPTDQWKTDGPHPKARYYRFKTKALLTLHRDF